MKILFTNIYFTTPKGKWSTRVYDISKTWVDKGHEVHVITARYYKSDISSDKFYSLTEIDGINIHLINILISNKQSLLKRIWTFILFSIVALFLQFKIKADRAIFSSGPISVLFNAFVFSIFYPKKTFLEIRDLWPEGIEELGILKNKLILKSLKIFVRLSYNRSNGIVVLSPGMKEYIVSFYKINSKKIIVATNFADFSLIEKTINNPITLPLPRKYFLYYGNLGTVNSVIDLCSIFENIDLKNEPHLVLIGDGQLKELVLEKSLKNSNIHFFDSIQKEDLTPIIKNSVGCFVPLQPGKIMGTSSPNKYFETLGCGTFIIHNTEGWIKKVVHKNNLGEYFDLKNKKLCISTLKSFNKKTEKDKKKIYSFAKKNYNKITISEEILNFILKK